MSHLNEHEEDVVASTVADHLLGRLREWGVDTVFGYAGDGINGLLAERLGA